MSMDEKIDIDDERKKEILELEARLNTTNYYELLGVPPGANAEIVKNAFHALSRKFHPDRFFGKNLGSFRARIDKIFKKLIEANEVLSDPVKLAAYLESNPFVRSAVKQASPNLKAPVLRTAADEAREAERRSRLARHPYLARANKVQELVNRAKEHMQKKEYGHAFSALNIAVQIEPSHQEARSLVISAKRLNDEQRAEADFQRGLDALQRGDDDAALTAFKNSVNANPRNAQAAHKAATLLDKKGAEPKESSALAQRAVEAEPNNPEFRITLGRLLEKAGMTVLARKHFEEAAKLSPDDPEVKKYVKKRWPF